MKVSELIEELAACNPDAEVVHWAHDQYGNPRVESLEWDNTVSDHEVYLL